MPSNNFDTIYLLQLQHSYFDRVIDRMETIDEYVAAASHYFVDNRNFDPGNDISTNLIIGSTTANAITFNGNYLLVTGSRVEQIDGVNTTVTFIVSRWWVTDQKRTRNGQYSLSLKRDVIADHLSIVEDAPCFIEKATIRDLNSPLLFNPEEMSFNQIKQSETFLKDDTKSAWIVGYIARNYAGDTWTAAYDVTTDYNNDTLPFTPDTVYKSASNIKLKLGYYYLVSGFTRYFCDNSILFNNDDFSNGYSMPIPGVSYTNQQAVYKTLPATNGPTTHPYLATVKNSIEANHETISLNFLNTYNYISHEDFLTFQQMNGKTYYDSEEDKYYKISVNTSGTVKTQKVLSNSQFGTAIESSVKLPVDNGWLLYEDGHNNMVDGYTTLELLEYSVSFSLEEYLPISHKIKISSSRNRLNDAPYDMFAIPFPVNEESINAVVTTYDPNDFSNTEGFTLTKETALHIAEAIAAHIGANLYDIQLLPYCPIGAALAEIEVAEDEWIECYYTPSMTENTDYNFVTDGGSPETNIGIVFWGTTSSITKTISGQIEVIDPKIENETKLYRLVSPNYSGMFEFSPAKNGGVNYYTVDITYKPYNPYIHVNPNFKNLYGNNFGDSRGLICGGDFSVAVCDDKWANYEINNKNYQLIFDREVQNMDFNRRQARVGEAFDLLTGTAAGAAQGASAGGVAGAIVGGVASAAGGVVDIGMSEARYREEKSLKTDLFGYNLGNIKALPASLTKSMSYTKNFKFWPFLEIYECSQEEKDALIQKLYYNGMTVMKIGKIADYIVSSEKSFIKGEIIRLPNLPEAADVAYEIYNEIKRGVFI